MLGLLLAGLLLGAATATYIEASPSSAKKQHEKFVPLVAFECGFRNKFMAEDGTWQTDETRYATCVSGKLDILKYCKKSYPKLNITNIVEYSHEVTIDKWCKEEGSPCKWSRTVRPYHCIDGEFRSEALQVPHDCKFSHVNSREMCNDYPHWKLEAGKQCQAKRFNEKPMVVRSFAVLEPCALDMFTGVEFVCCPAEASDDLGIKTKSDEDDDSDDDDSDYYTEEDEPEEDDSFLQDPYYKKADLSHEHENFKQAEERLDKKHRAKIDKVMKEWSELDSRYQEMKKTDPKGAEEFKTTMTNRFQKTVASLEEEHKRMKKELESVHEERVQTNLNAKKRDATHDFREALATHVASSNKHNVLQKLKACIRAEEKDRIHTLNRYRHLLRTDPEEAKSFRPTVLRRMRYIDLRINGTIAILRDYPDLEAQVRPIALAYWADYRREHTPELSDKEINELDSLNADKNVKLIDVYSESFEKTHPNAKLDVKAPPSSTTQKPTASTEKSRLLPASDDDDPESDEDDYYEDEDDEEVRKKVLPAGKNPAAAVKFVNLNPKKEPEPEKPKESPKIIEKQVQTDDDDDDDSESESDEDDDSEPVKELRVDIEPIIEETHSYYKEAKLVQRKEAESILVSANGLLIFLTACIVCFAFFVIHTIRKRHARHGFIEVDVYTPEERHVAGMQVNGYENPTYSFFDGKA